MAATATLPVTFVPTFRSKNAVTQLLSTAVTRELLQATWHNVICQTEFDSIACEAQNTST